MNRTDIYTDKLGRMIRCQTVSGYDDPNLPAFEEFQELLKELFPDLFRKAELELFHGSMLLRIKGKTDKMPIMFMNHQDTVEAQGQWTHPPFCGEVFDGKLWGRGALDTKGGLWAMLQAGDELCREGYEFDRDVYFESSCNEEVGEEGAQEISRELHRRGLRFDMIIDEGGMIIDEPIGGAKGRYAMVGMGEKACIDLKFTARSNGGHASTPEANTPLVRLGKFMAEADRSRIFTVEIVPTIQELFRRASLTVTGPMQKIYAKPEAFLPMLKAVMPTTSPTANALVRTTLAFTMAKGSEGRNVIPAEASVLGNMRASHHQGAEKSIEAVTKLAKKYDIETTVLDPGGESGLSDYRAPQFRLVEEAVSHVFPGVITAPYIMTGCSDARFMSSLTDNCYRFVPFVIDDSQMKSIHGIDECVDVSTLAPAVDFYRYIMTHI